MLLRWIESVRRKPKITRDQYAFFGALFVTGIIAVMWSLTLPGKIETTVAADVTLEPPSGAIANFFRESRENIANAIASIPTEAIDDEEESATTSDNISQETMPNVIIPTLTKETIERTQTGSTSSSESTRIKPKANERRVLIATSSDAVR